MNGDSYRPSGPERLANAGIWGRTSTRSFVNRFLAASNRMVAIIAFTATNAGVVTEVGTVRRGGSCVKDWYAEGLVEQTRRDAATLERDEAPGREGEQFVVPAKRCGPPVALPVGPAHYR